MTTSAGWLDGDAIARLKSPTARRFSTNLFDNSDGFVSGNHRQTQQAVELAVVLINVAAADAAGFDPHQGVIGANARQLELLHRKLFIADLNDRACLGHNGLPATLPLSAV